MQMRYFGDTYDVVKQCMLKWLRPFGAWTIFPMFTEPVAGDDIREFEEFLDAKVISSEVLKPDTNRSAYFAGANGSGNLLLDPDTGIPIGRVSHKKAPHYLFINELAGLVHQRPSGITLVFDQSIPRGSEKSHIEKKLHRLREQNVLAFAYISHTCFIFAGSDRLTLDKARMHLLAVSRLPADRFLMLNY